MKKEQLPTPVLIRHINKNIKMSPRKLRLLANLMKKISPKDALVKLPFINSKSARILKKEIKNAVSNALSLHYNIDDLTFNEIRIDEGLKYKRMDKSHGSHFARGLIQKRHSRLIITLKSNKEIIETPKLEAKIEKVEEIKAKPKTAVKIAKAVKAPKTTKKLKVPKKDGSKS
jgi:large subunit ribosomal protein L22